MKKTLVVLGILTLAGWLVPALITAQETQDHQAIRALFQKEQEGWKKDDGAQILSCYAEGYVQYVVPRWNGTPNFLLTTIDSVWLYENLKKRLLAPNFIGSKAALADTGLKAEWHSEISHIDVKGKEGVAIATFAMAWNDTLRHERRSSGWQSMWLLEKIDGQWKYVRGIGGITSYIEGTPLGQQ